LRFWWSLTQWLQACSRSRAPRSGPAAGLHPCVCASRRSCSDVQTVLCCPVLCCLCAAITQSYNDMYCIIHELCVILYKHNYVTQYGPFECEDSLAQVIMYCTGVRAGCLVFSPDVDWSSFAQNLLYFLYLQGIPNLKLWNPAQVCKYCTRCTGPRPAGEVENGNSQCNDDDY
jgi:hypothetical protein